MMAGRMRKSLERADIVVAGAGVVGLWAARKAASRGLRVVLCDGGQIGSGASGGLLGALMPHMPERWNPKKQFQFEALATLSAEINELEAETGISTGYRRIGRVIPLSRPRHRALAEIRVADAANAWQAERSGFSWQVRDMPLTPGWPAAAQASHGVVFETLAARVDPRRLLAALAGSLAEEPRVEVVENAAVADWSDGRAVLVGGREIEAGALVVAAGFQSFPLLERLCGLSPGLGKPVKGQAALIEADIPEDRPLLFQDGIYVVPHDRGRVAVGSTSENEFAEPFATDAMLDDLILRAGTLCPELAGRPVVARWAGLRPKAIGRDPLIGRMPGKPEVIAATGGFKITLGIAHKMAEAALDVIDKNDASGLPSSFTPRAHIARLTPAD